MKLNAVLTWGSLIIAGLLGLLFLIDVATGLFFQRFSLLTEICVIIAAGLIIWQGVETLKEL